MYRVVIALFLLFPLLWSCGSKDKANTIVTGNALGMKGQKLYLLKVDPAKKLRPDSVVVDSLGRFTFRLSLASPDFYILSAKNNVGECLFIAAPDEQIEINLPRNNSWSGVVVKGSASTILIRQLSDSLNSLKGRLDLIRNQFDTLKYSYRYDSLRKVLKKTYTQDIESYKAFIRGFILNQKPSLAMVSALYQKFDSTTHVLSQTSDVKYFIYVDSVLYHKYPASAVVKSLHQTVSDLKYQLNNQRQNNLSVGEGELAPNFVLPTVNGDTISLSKLKGKYVLLNFWAPWAKSSISANQNLPDVYAKYKPYGFEIIQVALARNREELVANIPAPATAWKHISEYRIWNSSMVKEYNVTSIPANFLINRQGVVVAKNVFNANLYDTLRWYLVRPYLLKRDSTQVNQTTNLNSL